MTNSSERLDLEPGSGWRVRPIFAWYDIWIGVFIDRPKRRIYVFPVPCFGLVIERKP